MSGSKSVSTKQQRIAELAKNAPDMAMDLSHHLDEEWFVEAFRRTRKDGAVGIDGISGSEYGESLDERIGDLIDRAKSGCYRAPPVRRVLIPKGDGKERRPIGVPSFEDKLLQRAIEMLLTPVFEQNFYDFYDFSYGFRPGCSAHQALHALRDGVMKMGGGYLIDLDIRSYFDSVDPKHAQRILRKRVRDGVVRQLIGKWLNAGVMKDGLLSCPETGVPQGGVISPLINYYGVTGNTQALSGVLYRTVQMWFKWLRRRSRKARRTWEWYQALLQRFPLRKPTPVHSVLLT